MGAPAIESLGLEGYQAPEELDLEGYEPPAPAPEPTQAPSGASPGLGSTFRQGASLARSDEALGEGYAHAPWLGGSPHVDETGMPAQASGNVPWFHRLARKITGDPNLPLPTTTPRAERGIAGAPVDTSSRDIAIQGERTNLAQEREAHPWLATPTEVAGAALTLAPATIATGGEALPLALEGAAVGGAYDYGKSEREGLGKAADTAYGAAGGAMLNVATPALMGAAGRSLSSLARRVGERASMKRLGATGAYGSDVAALTRSKGVARADQMARTMEDMGLGGVQSWQSTAEKAAPIVQKTGERIGELNTAATQAGVRVDIEPVAAGIEAEANALKQVSGLPDVQREASEMLGVAQGLRQTSDMSFAQAHKLRQWLDSKVWSNQKASFANPEAGQKAQMYRELAGKIRERINVGLNDAGQGEIAQALRQANREYEAAAFALNAASKRSAREGGNQALSMQSLIAGGTVGGGGALMSDPIKAGIAGAGTALATEGVKRYGNAAAATGMRGVERGLMSLARPAAPATRTLGSLARGGVAASATPPAASYDPATVLAMIDENPDAFGQLTPQVQAAAQSGNLQQMNEAIAYASRR